ncbi:hypothetical protein BJL95_10720 [Methylomonas sp. LWB]|uniref:ChuX/HutX family heme-like substrate-binding protein n=1 Tax=Methylomonas sp. LWB TaxID=1905845 RepID=UPI0008D9EADA|nr:ChuX/HutX family heme-like substrate-binding protein [Methylomonas sp. LWB]OHX36244.1 hypothetical protein BJL95_10720 [Methylomonas sp. LWB]
MLNTQLTQDATAPDTLKAAWRELLSCRPHLRIRDAAATLGVSEAELLATGCGDNVIRLQAGDWPALLSGVAALGPVMALTRNAAAVHEKTGEYARPQAHGRLAIVAGRRIDLCLALSDWYCAYAVSEASADGPRRSLQFFGADGEAIHKIYLLSQPLKTVRPEPVEGRTTSGLDEPSPNGMPSSNRAGVINQGANIQAYRDLVERFRAADQSARLELPATAPGAPWLNPQPELPAQWQRWTALWRHAETRQAAACLPAGLFRDFVGQLAQALLPIHILTASRAALQVHAGPVQNLRITGPWFNILDPQFNLHLNETAIDHLAIAELAFRHQRFSGLLLRDGAGRTVAALCGEFDEDAGESPPWRDFLAALQRSASPRPTQV